MDPQPFGITQLDQYTDQQLGAAARALLLTWLITADEVVDAGGRDRLCDEDQYPMHKLETGAVKLLVDQADWLDTELNLHAVGYAAGTPGEEHAREEPATEHEQQVCSATRAMANAIAYIVHSVQR